MLPKSLLCLTIALLASVDADDTYGYVDVLLRHVENPSGLLVDGTPCNKFGFAGVQCSMKLTATVRMSGDGNSQEPFHSVKISQDSNKADLEVIPLTFDLTREFAGFEIQVTLTDYVTGSLIDAYTYEFDPSVIAKSPEGYQTYTHIDKGRAHSSLTFAYVVTIPIASTTAAASTESIATEPTEVTETTVVTTAFTGSTPTPPPPPASCSDYDSKRSGIRDITVNGDIVKVYCDYGAKNDKVGLTVIQSRGSADSNEFSSDASAYVPSFGTPGIDHNFWLGLDNMHNLTKENNLYLVIDLCCKKSLLQRQYYQNFTIGKAPSFVISVDKNHDIGLDWNGNNVLSPDNGAAFVGQSATNGDCEITHYYDANFNLVSTTGAWWFGSCANNLNGPLIASSKTNGTCFGLPDTIGSTGIQMRTNAGYYIDDAGDKFYTDSVMYDRVRMAVYPSGTDTDDLPDAKEFCGK